MSETWADAQFDLLETAYNEIPIEAKARIEQLESSLDEVAEKWAIAQVNYEDCARRNTLLEVLVRDLYECNCACTCDECVRRNEEEWDDCEIINTRGTFRERMAALGLLNGDAS